MFKMAVRRQRATTSKEIMEKDVKEAIKKAKIRFRDDEKFYILKYTVQNLDTYFASSYPETDKNLNEEIYYQKWIFADNKWKEITK
jgi:hypothetical protein